MTTNTNVGFDKKIGILASGNGTSIQKLLNEKFNSIKIIITNNKNANVINKAKLFNIPFMFIDIPKSKKDKLNAYENIVNIFKIFKVDLVLLAGFMKIVPECLFDEFYTINIHPSLLPLYANLTGDIIHPMVINNNDIFSGCTLHKVTKEIDGGEILLQKKYLIKNNESPESLKNNIQNLENDTIIEFINKLNKSNSKINYKVNITEGNELVNNIKKINPNIGEFCGKFKFMDKILAASTDGCGTKIELANRFNKFDNIGIDLVAMNVNDLIAGGAKPLFFMDYIAIDKMNKEKCQIIIESINKGCKIANCELIGGETAEMKNIYYKNKYDIAGFAVGEVLYNLPKLDQIDNTCSLYGLKSSGIHSNGYSLVLEILENIQNVNDKIINELLEPTIIYNEVFDLLQKYEKNILGIAHITGGGFQDNIIRILPNNFDFELIDWEFPQIFKWIQQYCKLTNKEMLKIFNCGYGMVIISNLDLQVENLDLIGKIKLKY